MATAIASKEQDFIEPVELEAPFERSEVLFVGLGSSAVGWYRCYLPALFMGADWVGLVGEPPKVALVTGLVKRETRLPNFLEYKVVVLQQPRGQGWLKAIKELRSRGITVLYEIDDYVHGIKRMPDHDFRKYFSNAELRRMELCMRNCDGLIASTEYVARRYRRLAKRTWVCENAVDVGRYALTRPTRPTVNIGWAGATGHTRGVMPWLVQVGRVMDNHDDACFVSIGQDFASYFREAFPPNRMVTIPWTMLDVYPSAMTMFDVAIAPAGKGAFFQGKSDLRWVEAGALGIPIVADPDTYPHIEHGVTGFHARTPEEAHELLELLVSDPKLRLEVGENARDYVHTHRDMRVGVNQWIDALVEAVEGS